MQIILLKDVAKVGKRYTLVTVSEGYALNFLIPKGLARAATPAALRELEAQKATVNALHKAEEEKIANDIILVDGKSIVMHLRANEQGHLFAALRPEEITTAVYDQLGVMLPQTALDIESPIKTAGEHALPLAGGGKKGTLNLSIQNKE